MFKGSIPPGMRRILTETVRSWDVDQLAVGCSGNLTIERSLANAGLALSGNDVNIYSCTLGSALAGGPARLDLKPEWTDEFGWLEPYLTTPFDRAATAIVASDMLDGSHLGRDDEAPYFTVRREGYRHQWERLHAKTVEKLTALPKLADWFTGDLGDFLDKIGDAPFASFPPFYGGDYEAMYANLSTIFDWDEPTYPPLDEDRIAGMLAQMMDRPHWCIGLPQRRDDLDQWYTARTSTVLGGLPIHVYASAGPTRLIVPRTPAVPVGLPTLTVGDELTGNLELRVLNAGQFESLRRRYSTGIVNTAAPEACWALCDDGRVLGAFAVQARTAMTATGSTFVRDLTGVTHRPLIYLLSDFAVAPTDYPRISKLVVMAAVSAEVHALIEQYAGRRFRGIATTAFSNKPVSMKYRGILDLVHRAEDTNTRSGTDRRYRLNYHCQVPRWTLAEAWQRWSRTK